MQRHRSNSCIAKNGAQRLRTWRAEEVVGKTAVPEAAEIDAEGGWDVAVVAWSNGRFGFEVLFFVLFGLVAPSEDFVEFHR